MTTASQSASDPVVSQLVQRSLNHIPLIVSRRLSLRRFLPGDIGKLADVPRDHHKVDATADLYRPHHAEDARNWLGSPMASMHFTQLNWALCTSLEERVIGYSGLDHIDAAQLQAQLRFWIGCGTMPEARNSLANASECVEAVIDFAFRHMALRRVYALQLARQPRAGHVLAGVNMSIDGYLRKRVHEHSVFEDVACWAITADAWDARRPH